MSWQSKDGRLFPNRESKVGILWTDWMTWETAPPGAYILGWQDPATGQPQGLWWKCWWGFIEFDEKGIEVDSYEGNTHEIDHFTPFCDVDGHPFWQWDGNREKPTLSPSILINDRYYKDPARREVWHGFLQAGVFKSC